MVVATELELNVPISKLREQHLLSRMVSDCITISSNTSPVHSMVRKKKQLHILTYNNSISSTDLSFAIN
jgi:hypothetical protein